jgi:acetyl esterase/lipase
MRALTGLSARFASKGAVVEPIGSISARMHSPASSDMPMPALLWIHGGGFVLGSAAQDDALCAHVAEQLGIVVCAVEYRLAPKHQFPVPLHDCYDALAWLASLPHIDADRIAIGGASAGGGLAAALAIQARDRAEIPVAFQLLAYPMLDDRTALRSDIDERSCRLWNNKANRFGWESYTGEAAGSETVSALAAPARCEDLSGLPSAWIGVGTLDLFYDEDLAYGRRLEQAGVACALDVVDGAFHGFDLVRPKAGVSQAFRAAQVAALSGGLA